jgi:hypothetical protein
MSRNFLLSYAAIQAETDEPSPRDFSAALVPRQEGRRRSKANGRKPGLEVDRPVSESAGVARSARAKW